MYLSDTDVVLRSLNVFISEPFSLKDKKPFCGKPLAASALVPNVVVILPNDIFFCLINEGASFEISSILYFTVPPLVLKTLPFSVCFFFKIKNVSKSTLFLSAEGKLNQTLPSSAS